MAPENEASVGLRGEHDTEDVDDNSIVKVQMVLGSISLACFSLSLYFFYGRKNERESDPTTLDLMMPCSAYFVPILVYVMSCLRRSLSTNHPKWCFVVEMFQAISSSLTMIGSIQISIMQDVEENFLWCFGFLIVSLVFVEIIIQDAEDCGVYDMLVALFSTKLNTKHPKYVVVACFISYLSRRLGIFMMKQLKNERAESKEEESEREVKEIDHMDALNEMSNCWIATEQKLATEQPESDLEMKYPEFLRMIELIHEMKARAQGA